MLEQICDSLVFYKNAVHTLQLLKVSCVDFRREVTNFSLSGIFRY